MRRIDSDFSVPWPRIEKKGKRSKSFGDTAEIVYVLKNQENNIDALGHRGVYFKYVTILCVNYTSIKLNLKKIRYSLIKQCK